VDTAHNNREALALYDKGPHDLVLTDAEHIDFEGAGPDGLEGLELAEAIRKRNPKQHVGFITAHDHEILAYPTLHKPFEREELLRFVRNFSPT
jgi:CheY-like chemotaxis protein